MNATSLLVCCPACQFVYNYTVPFLAFVSLGCLCVLPFAYTHTHTPSIKRSCVSIYLALHAVWSGCRNTDSPTGKKAISPRWESHILGHFYREVQFQAKHLLAEVAI